MTAGVAALVVDAYRENNDGGIAPMDLLNTLAAEADEAHESYAPYNVGTGFVDAEAAVTRAGNGNLASFSDVSLVN